MPYRLDNRLVVGIASSALFDLDESDSIFRNNGEEAYRRYQEENLNQPLSRGVAFPFISRLLSLNDLAEDNGPLVEVIVLSRNDPDTGRRVMRSIENHNLAITRAIFMQGKSPYKFMPALNMSLFLSADSTDVREAIKLGHPAGQVLPTTFVDDAEDELRVAFDFDGVLADDGPERVMQAGGIKEFQEHEVNAVDPHNPGPLRPFLTNLNKIQRREEQRRLVDPNYKLRVRVSIVTARNAPAHDRAITSLKEWGATVNDAFFLGGVEKGKILDVLRPHIFFDDQRLHLETSNTVPSVHIPYGITNESLNQDPS